MDKNIDATYGSNYILDTIVKIDKMQKEAIVNETSDCVTCGNSLISFQNNTLPISIILRSGNYLTTTIGTTETATTFYRIEAVRCQQFVTLRQLELTDDTLTATPYTLILDIDCICGLECHTPIQATSCNLN